MTMTVMKKTPMKKTIASALVFAGIQLLTLSGAQADSGWYTKSSVLESDISGTSLNSTGRSVNAEFDQDTGFSTALGYRLEGSGIRLEAEYLSTENDADSVVFNGNNFASTTRGSLETETLFFNVVKEFNTGSYLTPYVGVGLGYSDIESNIAYNTGANITDSDESFAYQGLVGLDVKFSKSFSGFIEYRYVDLGDVDLNRSAGGQTSTQNGDIDFDAFGIGLAYHF